MSILQRIALLTSVTFLCSGLQTVSCAGSSPGSGDEATETTEATETAETTAPHGGPTNRLADETSPYLLLHKNNPVDWYPWGEEALAKARREDKPIFLSVGYSTCYWCHVMERESFSNPAIAALLNLHFVPIKVDREERPDLDEIYMTATQIFTQRGGWPNSLFLTPQLKPFFAGTYFPPEDRGGRPGFASLLKSLSTAWQQQRQEIDKQADRFAQVMGQVLEGAVEPAAEAPTAELAQRAAEHLSSTFDKEWGGFGRAPKFPSPSNLFLLLELADSFAGAEQMLATTFDRMARGGLYDQIGGGFHRYSTDAWWRVPHFEKMLYDNAHLLELYARWHHRSGNLEAARVVEETAAFIARELTSPEGALLSAIDAETDAEEGAYYVWSRDQLEQVLGSEQAAFLAPIFAFDGEPSFEGERYVLHLAQPLDQHATRLQITREQLLTRLQPLRQQLLAKRQRRARPLVDDKILTDWNGMAIAALATAGQLLEEPRYLEQAERAARFVLSNLRPKDGVLQHSWRQGTAKIDAYLSDYAFLVRGLLALHEATGDARWLSAARQLTDEQIARLGDPQGGFFLAAENPNLLYRSKDLSDGAIPAANGIAMLNLLRLSEITGEQRWRERATTSLKAFAPRLEKSPAGGRTLALAAWRHSQGSSPTAATPSAVSRLEAEAQRVVASTVTTTALEHEDRAGRLITVHLKIADGWHLNANPASDELLIPTQLEASEGDLEAISYPPGEPLKPAFAKQEISVYQGTVSLTGTFYGSHGLRLIFQACDDQRCLPPVSRQLTLD